MSTKDNQTSQENGNKELMAKIKNRAKHKEIIGNNGIQIKKTKS